MNTDMQMLAEKLANKCLEHSEVYHKYTDEDLLNATLIFSHFFMDVLYTTNQNITFEKQQELAEEAGKAIRELIKMFTSKDMHLIAKQ
jgi:hypothetical protein